MQQADGIGTARDGNYYFFTSGQHFIAPDEFNYLFGQRIFWHVLIIAQKEKS